MWEDNAQVQAINIITVVNMTLVAVVIVVAGIIAVGKHLHQIVCKEFLTVNGFIQKPLATIKHSELVVCTYLLSTTNNKTEKLSVPCAS